MYWLLHLFFNVFLKVIILKVRLSHCLISSYSAIVLPSVGLYWKTVIMNCSLCFMVASDPAHCMKAPCHFHHKFHPACVKLKCSYESATEAAESVHKQCPVCAENDTLSLASPFSVHLSKLSKLDKLDSLEKLVQKLHGYIWIEILSKELYSLRLRL